MSKLKMEECSITPAVLEKDKEYTFEVVTRMKTSFPEDLGLRKLEFSFEVNGHAINEDLPVFIDTAIATFLDIAQSAGIAPELLLKAANEREAFEKRRKDEQASPKNIPFTPIISTKDC